MIKVFTTNKNGKIELTKEELKNLLDEAYWDGYRANNCIYTYTSPTVHPTWQPYSWTACGSSITLNANDISSSSTTSSNTSEVKL